MRFGVLGSLAVWTESGTAVRIPELKVRALLADLLAHEGRPAPADRLADDLWGDAPPGNPTNTLQTKVSQLRRALEGAAPGARRLVAYQSPGYRLLVEPDTVDANRFRALVAEAARASDARTRADLLTQALDLWRGPALEDFRDEPFAAAFIARLDEERVLAHEELAETRLDLGEHTALTALLGDLVARYPLRERLRAAHIRALYGAGQQGQALDSFRDLRDRLAEELGIDPGPELVRLHQAVLEQAASLGVPSPSRPRTDLPVPPTELVGRGEAVTAVCRLLDRSRLVTLTGSGGVGKTRLALEVGHRLDGFPDGVRLVSLTALEPGATTAEVAELVLAVLDVRDESGSPLDGVVAALRARRAMLVLDSCEHVGDAAAEVVDAVLAAAPEVRLLATGQEPLGVAGEHQWNVPPLPLADAVALFRARAEAAGSPPVPASEVVEGICRRLDGIPLALELAATRVRALGVRELANRLDDRFRLLAVGRRGAPARQQTLRATIDWSWRLLSEPEQAVLRQLAVHADGCTLAAAEAVSGGPDVVELLSRLVGRSLVVAADGRYRLLESIAAYALERLAEAGELDATRQRHWAYHLDLAEHAETLLRGPEQQHWLARLDAETANLRTALDNALPRAPAAALRLVNALVWYWFLRGRLREAARSLDLAIAAHPQPSAARSAALAWRAGILMLIGTPVDLAVLEPGAPARARLFLGFAASDRYDPATSERVVADALSDLREADDRWGIAGALSTQAKHAYIRGDLPLLERSAEESHRLFVDLGDRWGQLQATEWLGALADQRGDYATATRLHEDGVRIAEELGSWPQVADRISWLGRVAMLRGDLRTARELLERGLRLATEQSYGSGVEFAELGLGLVARRAGDNDEAERRLRRFTGTDEVHPTPRTLALTELASMAADRGEYEAAATLLGRAAAVRDSTSAPVFPSERGDVERATAAARSGLGAERYATAFDRGRHGPA